LVAVFDHDYDAVLSYVMKKIFLTKTLPWFIVVFVFTILIGTAQPLVLIVFVLPEIVLFVLAVYGNYRLNKSQVYALHMAVARDGVRAVYDEHLEDRCGITAALHCWDKCLLVARRDETVSSETQDVACYTP
jgi:hypothetical protein